ncbi:MAG: hypothetical protein LBD73_07785 [Deferribacteraceae bacterium]|jgi:hypothetical protein|nr:hypothetical protein [Deferribacteraceae bacterium]
MRKRFFLVILLFFSQSVMADIAEFSYLSSNVPHFSYLNEGESENSGVAIPKEVISHNIPGGKDGGMQTVFNIAEELSPAVERYAFDDNVTRTQLYFGLSSALLSYATRRITGDQLDLRLYEEVGEDNKSSYSLELGFRPISLIGFNFLVPNGAYMFGLSVYPAKGTALSFTINDNNTATVTGFNINTVF